MARKRRPFIDDGGYPEYKRLCRETQGFDVNSAGRYLCGGVGPFYCRAKNDLKEVISIAEFALDDYNKKKILLKVNLQIVGGGMWYITFKAYSPTTRLIKVYQAKVWEQVLELGFQVLIFREKLSSKALAFPIPTSISTPHAAFLCFRNDVARILQSLQGRKRPRRHIKSLALKAWRSMSTAVSFLSFFGPLHIVVSFTLDDSVFSCVHDTAKYVYYHTRPLEYEDLTQFGLLNMPKMSEVCA